MTEAERDHLRSDFISAGLEVARLRAALSKRVDPFDDFHPPEGASPSLIEMNRQFLRKRCLDPTFSAGCGRARVGARGAPTHVDFRAYAYVEAGPGSAAAD
jgi:hypothetical protein